MPSQNHEAALAALADLGLSPEETATLSQQGFVSAEQRGKRRLYKLRFRCGGRQQVRSLGYDPQRAAVVQRALQQLQSARHRQLSQRRRLRDTLQKMKAFKRRVAPLLEGQNQYFHGLFLRTRRTAGHLPRTPISSFPERPSDES